MCTTYECSHTHTHTHTHSLRSGTSRGHTHIVFAQEPAVVGIYALISVITSLQKEPALTCTSIIYSHGITVTKRVLIMLTSE